VDELKDLLGRGRAKKGMFEGDLTEGELEIGQAAAHLREILPAGAIVKQMMHDCETTIAGLQQFKA
jgi:enoyl-[acyl-carrier protein] reductase II